MYIRTSFICPTLRVSSIRIYILIGPIFNIKEANYDVKKTEFLVTGFEEGFDLQYQGLVECKNTSKNLPLCIGSKLDIWQKIMKEVSLKRYAGPYKSIPFGNYVQSPIGLVPKAGGKTRLIFHLSFNFGPEELSINHYTPKHFCTVKYHDLDDAVITQSYGMEIQMSNQHFVSWD